MEREVSAASHPQNTAVSLDFTHQAACKYREEKKPNGAELVGWVCPSPRASVEFIVFVRRDVDTAVTPSKHWAHHRCLLPYWCDIVSISVKQARASSNDMGREQSVEMGMRKV